MSVSVTTEVICPLQRITAHCTVKESSHLIWKCADTERLVFCNADTEINILPLNCQFGDINITASCTNSAMIFSNATIITTSANNTLSCSDGETVKIISVAAKGNRV